MRLACAGAAVAMAQAPAPAAEQHWAFAPVKKAAPPPAFGDWSHHPIDRFIAASWRQRSLQPVPPAEPRALLRRLYFDLVGLPPAPEALDAFVRDPRPDAVLRIIDQLL